MLCHLVNMNNYVDNFGKDMKHACELYIIPLHRNDKVYITVLVDGDCWGQGNSSHGIDDINC